MWTNTALVRETVPSSRANFKWLFNRSIAMGTRKYIHIIKEKKMPYILLLTQTILKFMFGMIAILLSLPFGKTRLYKTIFQWARSLGVLKSILGSKYQEYLKEHHGN